MMIDLRSCARWRRRDLHDRMDAIGGFPTTAGAYDRIYGGGGDAYVAKLDPTGVFSSGARTLRLGNRSGLRDRRRRERKPNGCRPDLVAALPATSGAFDATYVAAAMGSSRS